MDSGLSHEYSSQTKWGKISGWSYTVRLKAMGLSEETNGMYSVEWSQPQSPHCWLWLPSRSVAWEEPEFPVWQLCHHLCAPPKQLLPDTCFHIGTDEEKEGGGGGGGSFWCCTLQFRSCSVPTQIKTSPVAYVNMLPTVLRFNEPWYERHLKPMENNWPLKVGVRLTGDR